MSITDLVDGKRIVIYGTGNNGNAFYTKYKEYLHIEMCTSSDANIVPIPGLRPITSKELDKEKDFIIICSIYFEEIRRTLIMQGWTQNVNFIRWDIFDCLFEAVGGGKNKLLMVAVGQCEIQEICIALNRIQAFKEKYLVIYFDERQVCCHGDRFDSLVYYDCDFMLRFADVYLRPSVMNPKSVRGFDYLQSNIKRDCRIIKVSLFIFDSYWPQDIAKERSISKYYMIKQNTKIPAFVERERVIENLLDSGYSIREIKRKISTPDFFDENIVLENHKMSMRRIKVSDKLSDIKVYDYVEANYNKIKIFCDRGHFNENMVTEYVKSVLAYLEEDESAEEFITKDISDIFARVNELPIYPSTAKILRLSWIDENTLYRMNINGVVRRVIFDEYIEQMLEYYSRVKELIEMYYTDNEQ